MNGGPLSLPTIRHPQRFALIRWRHYLTWVAMLCDDHDHDHDPHDLLTEDKDGNSCNLGFLECDVCDRRLCYDRHVLF